MAGEFKDSDNSHNPKKLSNSSDLYEVITVLAHPLAYDAHIIPRNVFSFLKLKLSTIKILRQNSEEINHIHRISNELAFVRAPTYKVKLKERAISQSVKSYDTSLTRSSKVNQDM